jgi:hypothetical protein
MSDGCISENASWLRVFQGRPAWQTVGEPKQPLFFYRQAAKSAKKTGKSSRPSRLCGSKSVVLRLELLFSAKLLARKNMFPGEKTRQTS